MNSPHKEEVTPLIPNTNRVVSSTSINNGNYQQQDNTLTRRNVSPSTLERADIGKDYYTENHSNRSSSSDLSNLEKQPIYKAKGTKKQKFLFHFFNISCPLFIVVLVALGLGVGLIFILSRTQTEVQPTGTKAAVASDSTICSEMGLKVIKEKKGNAVDASIVVALCLGVTRPFASGIGGGGFITIFMNETKTVDFINARETAPSAASQDMYEKNYDESVFGGKSIAVYGEIKGLYTAHTLYGKLPWKELFTDVIDIARNGWIVEPLLALRLSQDDILKFPTLVQFTTVGSDGKRRVYHEGELIKRTDLANTLEKIAAEGPNILYEGTIAQKIVEEIQQQGGIITLEDLKNYQPERPFYDENSLISQKDMTLNLNDFKVILPPPPSAGPVIKFILSILNNFKVGENSPMGLNYHYILEALKFGFGHRSNLGDVNFLPKENVTKYIINQLLSDSYASNIASEKVSPSRTFPWSHYYSDNYAPVKDKGTSHFSVIDENGNSVAMTTTVNHNFGSKVASASTGIVFNNQMNDFTVDLHKPNQFGLPPSAANVIAPGKRPLSSMSPAIFLDKSGSRVKYIIGASGGPTIISAIIEVFYSIEKFKVQPNLAVALPRLHAQPGSDVVKMEEGFNRQVITALQEKGHTFEPVQILPDGHTIGCCQVIQVSTENDQNLFLPGTDPRKLGTPACF